MNLESTKRTDEDTKNFFNSIYIYIFSFLLKCDGENIYP